MVFKAMGSSSMLNTTFLTTNNVTGTVSVYGWTNRLHGKFILSPLSMLAAAKEATPMLLCHRSIVRDVHGRVPMKGLSPIYSGTKCDLKGLFLLTWPIPTVRNSCRA